MKHPKRDWKITIKIGQESPSLKKHPKRDWKVPWLLESVLILWAPFSRSIQKGIERYPDRSPLTGERDNEASKKGLKGIRHIEILVCRLLLLKHPKRDWKCIRTLSPRHTAIREASKKGLKDTPPGVFAQVLAHEASKKGLKVHLCYLAVYKSC